MGVVICRFARLEKLQIVQAARMLYIRFVAITGDAMGMNMLSKVSGVTSDKITINHALSHSKIWLVH